MRFAAHLLSLATALLLTTTLASQNVNMEHPQEVNIQHHLSAEEIRDRLYAPQVQADAKEMADLCAAISSEMNSIKQGLLPQDIAEKLKRMEKLSKHMRESLTRVSADR